MPHRPQYLVLASLTCFAAGVASAQLLEHTAHAQTAPFASTFYVPTDGLAFRSFDGRVIARLSYDRGGGVFEVYNADEHPSSSMRSDAVPPPPAPPVAPPQVPEPRPRRARAIDFGF